MASRMRCAGCGLEASPDAAYPFRCARAGTDDVDHVMTVALDVAEAGFPDRGDENPFVRTRALHHAWHLGRRHGVDDDAYVALVRALDQRVAAVWGHGFAVTPYARQDALAAALGLDPARHGLWLKDETGDVAGSHKARHLMGLAVHLEIVARAGLAPEPAPRLAIASCGNAALAAAVIARAAGRALEVFVPTWAEAGIVERLGALGARVVRCARADGDPPGDPCYHRFQAAVSQGALPFACQGNQNGLTIQGGQTLGWELAAQHAATGAPALDRLVVQVGGGALASSLIQALQVARDLGAVPRVPAIHAVQAAGGHPLRRAWRRAAEGVVARLGEPGAADMSDPELARWIGARDAATAIHAEMAEARAHRSRYMWPWETAPRSVATGILDDETYDWAVIVEAMLATGGWPVVVEDHDLTAARDQVAGAAGMDTDATGAAGVAGVRALARAGAIGPGEHIAALVTGAARKLPRAQAGGHRT